ncbi:MAG: cyclic pyranopterin monophosphate synthase MoaC [Pelagibacteraceae bacterium]|mgnify:CR=1 FL=1|jgi:cyclic pyranopterin phosphate synthase|nr:cyclic pyranopterin monophosphate synthase MoaC [Pelagibacteraceae bacterium]|tara:strand:- start:249 stop:704 length:456 start_codon:yes stop_codon:yes gene_type:complete
MSKQTKKNVKMIDVANKKVTKRTAIAEAFINLNTATKEKIYKDRIIKGDVISVAKTAGILAAKKTSDIIPLCHQIPLNSVEIEIINKSKGLLILSKCNSSSKTGVEMEALLSVSITALTIYDMCKSIDKSIEIREIRLLSKKGGKSGNYKR